VIAWYILARFGILYHEKSGSPVHDLKPGLGGCPEFCEGRWWLDPGQGDRMSL
jgi:hypothetical protein